MGASYYSSVIIGISLGEVLETRNVDRAFQRFDQIKGKPYELYEQVQVVNIGDAEFEGTVASAVAELGESIEEMFNVNIVHSPAHLSDIRGENFSNQVLLGIQMGRERASEDDPVRDLDIAHIEDTINYTRAILKKGLGDREYKIRAFNMLSYAIDKEWW
jgi:hypothetical protein